MAFGETWGIVTSATVQVAAGTMSHGIHGEAIYHTARPKLADSAIFLMDSVPAKSSFPAVDCFFQPRSPHFRRQQKQVDLFLRNKLAESRTKMAGKGEAAVKLADNALGE